MVLQMAPDWFATDRLFLEPLIPVFLQSLVQDMAAEMGLLHSTCLT